MKITDITELDFTELEKAIGTITDEETKDLFDDILNYLEQQKEIIEEDTEERIKEIEEKLEYLKGSIEEGDIEPHTILVCKTIYDEQKAEICKRLFQNLNLNQLQTIEAFQKSTRKNYME